MNCRITNNLKILFIFALHLSLGGGIGRRARLKLVFFGVWVRFPPKVLTLQRFLEGFLLVYLSYTSSFGLAVLVRSAVNGTFEEFKKIG